ncbi:endoribonuclease YbeY [Camelimonas fluminis]|uniref:Endoribonuclease YbeY n=1 Tax=Camelimonas fluminis TaxID=1576911 RepID=A0ABV7ULA8_9HYPH|nr:rRNA maturation RNase YbeY [Camelimonas fluminis]GHE54335.1 endoribonuclease YbeY [Camelimonas fluminis]
MSASPLIDVVIESPLWQALRDAEALAGRAALAAVAASGVAVMDGAELSLMLADDAAVQELNRTWRGKDKPTNVLSWPAADPDDLVRSPHCGDIAVAYETLVREAADEGKTVADHFTHLVVHGVLHLLGYDHETDDEAEEMETLETDVLAGLGVADPYGPDGAGMSNVAGEALER